MSFVRDARYGLRLIARRPAFTTVAALTLALGIGGASAMFGVVRAVLLTPFPYADPDRLVVVWNRWVGFDKTWISELELADYQREARSLAVLGAWSDGSVNLTGGGTDPERVVSARVTHELFTALGTAPLLGRTFSKDEDAPGGPPVVVLGHDVWRQRYGADPALVGRAIEVDGAARTVVGIMPPGFALPLEFAEPEGSQLWLPLAIDLRTAQPGNHGLYAVGRLRPGATASEASAELRTVTARLTAEGLFSKQMRFEAFAVPLDDEVVGPVRPALWLLLGAVGFLLAIACANVGHLLLARADERRREVAVRLALGADRSDLVRQLFIESVLLAALGGAAGLALGWVATSLLAALPLSSIPRLSGARVDVPVLLFTTLVTAATSVAFGLLPAFAAARVAVVGALKDGAAAVAGGNPTRQHTRGLLVAGQMAVAVVLLVGAVLMLRSLGALRAIDPGFRPDGVLTLRVSLPVTSYPEVVGVVGFFERLLPRVRAVPGVTAAGAVRSLPLASMIGDWGLRVEGYTPPPGTNAKGDWQVATPGYLDAMGERLVRGRWFADADRADTQQVAVVNETMARKYWPGQDPIGRRIRQGSAAERPWITVVGIVADVRHNGLTGPVKEKFYRPHAQFFATSGNVVRSMTVVVRAAGDPIALAGAVRAEVRRLDPNLPVSAVRTMDEVVGQTMAAPRLASWLLTLFASVALVLAAVGVYGVLAYVVRQRQRELGVRLALGATPADVRWLVLRRGLGLCGVGLVVGLGAAWAGSRLIESQLYGVTRTDPVTFAAVPAILAVTAVVASIVPAVRASRVEVVRAMREE